MLLLADATGQTATVPNTVMAPWLYEYAYPNDCIRAIYVPWQAVPAAVGAPPGNAVPPNSNLPLTGAAATFAPGYFRPGRFLIARDTNFPPPPGTDWEEIPGLSPMGQTVVLTNVPQASLVYTSLVLPPSEWDPMFREAMVAYYAAEIVLPLSKDKKFAFTLKRDLMQIAERKVNEARAQSANENTNINSSFPDWINVRNRGSYWGGGLEIDANWGGPGYNWGGYDGFGSLGGATF